jgi:metal transporter CNNM
MDIINCLIPVFLVSLSALFSGLTLGLFSISKTDLETEIKLNNPYAKKVYEIRKNGNFLLCILLLGNVAVNAALAIFLNSLTNGIIASILATALIFFFGELLPQAVCYRYALAVGAKTVWFVKILMFLFYPIAKPISLVLDRTLGKERPTIYSKAKLQKIVEYHKDQKSSSIDEDEERIVRGALSFSDKKVKDIMTPQSKIFALDKEALLTPKLVKKIARNGFSRIPVYDTEIDNIVGVVFVKHLLGHERENRKVDNVYSKNIYMINENDKLDKALNQFLNARNHLFIVKNHRKQVVGLVTIEDVIEEILKKEIVDETDRLDAS